MMNNETHLKKALLEQEGLQAGSLPDQQRKEIEMVLEQELKRVQRMRWTTGVLWVLWISLCVVFVSLGVMQRRVESEWGAILLVVWIVLLPIAMASTISLYIRWRAASQRELRMRLTLIEEQLKRLAGES